MGEVYRATDATLKRQVAIKVLPAALAADAERLTRVQREAEVLASLNHPNIAHLYGIEEGAAEAGHHIRALVMELVEGPTLADRVAHGPMPVAEALPIAKQTVVATGAEGVNAHHFFSPDGRWVGFHNGLRLMKVPLTGGRPVLLATLTSGEPRGSSWAPDDTIVVAVRGGGLVRVPAAGGEPSTLVTPDDDRSTGIRRCCPGGARFSLPRRSRSPTRRTCSSSIPARTCAAPCCATPPRVVTSRPAIWCSCAAATSGPCASISIACSRSASPWSCSPAFAWNSAVPCRSRSPPTARLPTCRAS